MCPCFLMIRRLPARLTIPACLLILFVGCDPDRISREKPTCSVVTQGTLPAELHETSGVAVSAAHPGLFWTHNDSRNDPLLFGVSETGTLLARMRVDGAENVDWEDIALAQCPAGSCLYIGDIGDNHARRSRITVYRVPEPHPGDTLTAPAERIYFVYPDGPRDAESLFVTPDGTLHIITKGREGPIRLFRSNPGPTFDGSEHTLTEVTTLRPAPSVRNDRVTAAALAPRGDVLAVRTYSHLQFFEWPSLAPVFTEPGLSLEHFQEPQGEAVDILDDGRIVITSEANRRPAMIRVISCGLEEWLTGTKP
jgi:hypothetical protein